MTSTSNHPAVLIAHEKGLIRANELAKFGASGAVLQQLLATGQLIRVTRYFLARLLNSDCESAVAKTGIP